MTDRAGPDNCRIRVPAKGGHSGEASGRKVQDPGVHRPVHDKRTCLGAVGRSGWPVTVECASAARWPDGVSGAAVTQWTPGWAVRRRPRGAHRALLTALLTSDGWRAREF
jgi:hypothetical protein